MTATPRRRRMRLAIATLGFAALGFGATTGLGIASDVEGPAEMQAAWVSQEAAAATATADVINAPTTSCEVEAGSPHVLHLGPATTGLATYGFRVTVATDSGSTPGSWQTGTTADGVAFLAANTPTVVTTSAVAWGIESGWNTTSTGTVTVEALTTGGWASTTVSYPWEISFNILGGASASCG